MTEISDEPALRALGEKAGGDVLVILDQFEEYFLYHPDTDDDRFATAFPRLVERPDLRANFLISIREDALAKLDCFKRRIPELFDNLLPLDRLDRDAARQAIVAPLHHYNKGLAEGEEWFRIEPELVDAVLEQVAAGRVVIGAVAGAGATRTPAASTIEAPYLQLVMSRIWAEERAADSRVLRHETLVRLGGAARIVHTHVDTVMSAFEEHERDVAARIFHQLVTPSGTKIAHTVADLAQLSDAPLERVKPVVDELAGGNVRILRPVAGGDSGVGRVELFHDVLAEAVLDWRTRYVRDQRERERRLAEEQRRRELKYRFVVILALALLVAVIAAVALTIFAVRERDKARSSALVAHSVAAVTDPELAVLLAGEGIERDQSNDAAEALVAGLSQLHLVATMSGGTDDLVATPRDGSAFTPDGTRVVTASGNDAAVWSVATGALVHSLEGHRDHVFSASFSPDGDTSSAAIAARCTARASIPVAGGS